MKNMSRIFTLCLILLLFTCTSFIFAGGQKEKPAPVKEEAAPAKEVSAPEKGSGMWEVYELAAYEAKSGKKLTFKEAPMLSELVSAGKLKPLKERLPEEPVVVQPAGVVGKYGKTFTVGGIKLFEQGDMLHMGLNLGFEGGSGEERPTPSALKGYKISADRKTYTIYMRKGLKWSDGHPFTADDIVFWFNDIANDPTQANWYATMWDSWKGANARIEKVNDYEVKFYFDKTMFDPHYEFANGFQSNLYPSHVLKKFHKKYTKDADEQAKKYGHEDWVSFMTSLMDVPYNLPEEVNKLVPKLNPWIFKKDIPGGVLFERNPYYYEVDTEGKQLPYLDQVIFVGVENAEVYKLKVLAGEFDIANTGFGLDSYPLLAEEAKKGTISIDFRPSNYSSPVAYWFNHDYVEDLVLGEILRDKRFHQALSMAIDRDYINETLYFGKGIPAQVTVIPSNRLFEEKWRSSYAEYDVSKANSLLDKMGLTWDSDHKYRVRSDGKKLEVEVVGNENMPEYTPTMEIIRDYWEAVGVKANHKIVSKSNQSEYCRSNKFQISQRGSFYLQSVPFVATMGRSVDLEPRAGRRGFAPRWGIWSDEIAKGEANPPNEPPEPFKEFILTLRNLSTYPKDEMDKKFKWLFDFQAEQLLGIGTVAQPPFVIVYKKDLKNVPEGKLITANAFYALKPQTFYWE